MTRTMPASPMRSTSTPDPRREVEGHRLPVDHAVTANEQGWLELVRDLSQDADPPVTLKVAQALRQALKPG